MKCTIPEISWHNREPVLSVDIHPISSEFYKLASGGGDSHVLIWQMTITENGAVKQDVVSDLTRHQRAVNCVRWSPDGKYLASADDDANIIVWQLKTDNVPLLEGDAENKETWIVYKVMRGHKEDIYDLSWSIDGSKLFSGSVDNTAILWDLAKGKMDHILTDHKGFVQGVSWDPKNQYLSSISTDRICRLFDISGKHVKARIQKGMIPVPSNHFLSRKEVKYFHDDTFKSFFRRLEFSPDGSLLVVPSGRMEADDCKKVLCATLIFTMDNYTKPSAILPIPNQCSTVVRFCPVLFTLREDGPEPLVKLPYRMVFAIGTDHDIILYDTQQKEPFARFHEIHYTRLTDLTWSQDGLLLTASSTDGFCALVTFDPGEMGTVYVKGDSESEETQTSVEVQEKVELKEQTNNVVEKKRPCFLEKWALSTPLKKVPKRSIDPEEVIEVLDGENDAVIEQDETGELSQEIKDQINQLIPSRSASKTTTSLCQDAKPIEVRKRPRDETTQQAKAIDVVKKPRDDSVNNRTPKLTSSDASANGTQGAKPIEVRKKPRIEMMKLEHSAKETSNASAKETKKNNTLEMIKRQKESKACDKSEGETVILIDTSDEGSSDESDEGDDDEEQLSKNIKDEICNLLPTKATSKVTMTTSQDRQLTEGSQQPREDAAKEKINVLIPRKKSSFQQKGNESEKNGGISQTVKICKSNKTARNNIVKENGHDVNDVKLLQQVKVDLVNTLIPKKALLSVVTSKNTEAKTIEVRKQPRNVQTDCSNVKGAMPEKSNQNSNGKGMKKQAECRLGLENNTKDIDNIESSSSDYNKSKMKDDKISSETKLCTKDSKEPSTQSSNNKYTKTVKQDNTLHKVEEREIMVIEDGNDMQKLDKKDARPAKNKTSSSKKKSGDPTNKTPKTTPTARKKLCTTSPSNSLLSFLKRSSDKKKSTRPSTVIDLTDGDEARDGWSEDKSAVEEDKDNLGVTPMEEDHTEDFCLRLEDTQDAETDKEKMDKQEKDLLINKVKLEEKKVPRRVPLITLSSPKGKKTSNTNA